MEYQKENYSIRDVLALVSDLKFIQKLKNNGDKLNTYTRSVQPLSLYSSLSRTLYYTQENRHITVDFIKNTINRGLTLALEYIPNYGIDTNKEINKAYVRKILKNIVLCKPSIQLLKDTTYADDTDIDTKLEFILLKINAMIKQSKFSFPQNIIKSNSEKNKKDQKKSASW